MPHNEPTNADLSRDVEQLRREVATLTASTKDLVDAWKAAGTTLTFIKWIASLATAVSVAWLAVSGLFHR